MKKKLLGVLSYIFISLSVFAQDQTVNGDLYIGQGYHDQLGYGKRITFLGNTDPCFITQYNVAGNITEFRFNMGEDLNDDKFVVGVTNSVDGQWYSRLVVRGDGFVGIGIDQPTAKLEVTGGDIKASGNLIVSAGNATGGGIKLADDGDIVDLNDDWATHRFSNGLRVTNGNATGSPVIQLANGVKGTLKYFNAGNVGIGTTNPDAKLAVNGTIHTREVRVDTQNFPDFVFKPSYSLPSLTEVKNYIDQKGHLPGMPSEAEAIKEGISLGEMNKKLLQKVEELTLYLIQQDIEIKVLKENQLKMLNGTRTDDSRN